MAQTRVLRKGEIGGVGRKCEGEGKCSTRISAIRQRSWRGRPGFPERPTPFLSFVQSYSTLLPGLMGGQLVCGGRRTWELHPSEDLSELHRLLVSVAMQKYHCRQTRSWRGSLPRLLLDERVSLGTFRFGACIDTGDPVQVVMARSPHRCPLFRRLIC